MKHSLPTIRLQEETLEHIQRAIKKYNESNLVNLKIAEFRRLAYELLAQLIIQGKEIPVKIK